MCVCGIGILCIIDSKQSVQCILPGITGCRPSDLGLVHSFLGLSFPGECMRCKHLFGIIVKKGSGSMNVDTSGNLLDVIGYDKGTSPLAKQRLDCIENVLR